MIKEGRVHGSSRIRVLQELSLLVYSVVKCSAQGYMSKIRYTLRKRMRLRTSSNACMLEAMYVGPIVRYRNSGSA